MPDVLPIVPVHMVNSPIKYHRNVTKQTHEKKIPDLKRVRPANEVAIKEEWWEKKGGDLSRERKKKKKNTEGKKKKKIKDGELG